MRWLASSSSSQTVSAAITVSRASPISPNLPRRLSIRDSRLSASFSSRVSWPSSQAIRNCRPLMVTLTWLISLSPGSSTERMVPIAASSLSAISRLVRSSRRDLDQRSVEFVGEPRRSAPSAWIRAASSFSSRSASRRRSTALSSASSADISRRVAASISAKTGSALPEPLAGRSFMRDCADLPSAPAGVQNSRLRQAFRGEIYVASEASATPLPSYAPLRQFLRTQQRSPGLGLTGTRCYPAPDFPCLLASTRGIRPRCGSPAKHLISGGYSS